MLSACGKLRKRAKIDFGEAHKLKEQLLRKAYERYTKTTDTTLRSAFETFAQQHAHWLDDYALFRALKDAHGGSPGTSGNRHWFAARLLPSNALAKNSRRN